MKFKVMIVDGEPDILASIKSIYDYLTKPIDFKQLLSSVKKCNMYLFERENIEK